MATTWGNYTDYSGPSKRPCAPTHVVDPRLNLLATLIPGLFAAKACLDIGCNAGSVSCQLALQFSAASVTGVDIDPHLVAQADQLLALRASRVCPPSAAADRCVDYFPISAVLRHGYRIEPARKASKASSSAAATPVPPQWPSVTFVAADWLLTTNRDISGPYDVILALSVIKWIHLEHLDPGLRTFFRKCSTCLQPGGHLVIELQTWDSYEKAVRPSTAPHFLPSLQRLNYRPESSFAELLAAEGLHLHASSTALPRRIDVYRKVE